MKCFGALILLFGIGMLTGTSANEVESRLLGDLFTSYDKKLLPSHNEPVQVDMRMTLSNLNGLDFFEGVIHMNIWQKLLWRDTRLQWNPEEYENISILRVPSSDVWIPDITLYNSYSPPEPHGDVSTLLYSDGTVYFLPPMSVKAVCNTVLHDYPYDSHDCHLKFGSWVHDNSRVSLKPSSDTIDLEDYFIHPVWDVVNTSAKHNMISYPCCAEVYEDVQFHVTVRRRENHGRIASSVIAAWLILVVFLIGPSSAGERIVFSGFVFVGLVVLSASLSAEIPNSSTSRLGRFHVGGMMITAIVIVVNGLIYRFSPKDRPGQLKDEEASKSRVFLLIDIGAFIGTLIILAIATGALFA